MKKITKAVIPAAGMGTRFLPATKALPKEMLPIIDTPNIHYIVKEAVEAGIKDILIIVSSAKEAIEDYFDVNYDAEGMSSPNGSATLYVVICAVITVLVLAILILASIRPKWSK